MVKKTLGRRKIEMKKMEKESNLQVTFSRRRASLFKKANELSVLCGAEVGVVVFSPSNKLYSFGSPSMCSIINKFEGKMHPQTSFQIAQQRNAVLQALGKDLQRMEKMLESERKHGEELDKGIQARANNGWWETPIEELNLDQLLHFKASLQGLRGRVTGHLQSEKALADIVNHLFSD